MKRAFSLLICIVFVINCISVSIAFAEDITFRDGADHIVDGPTDGGVIASEEGTSIFVNGDVITPDTSMGDHQFIAVSASNGSDITVDGDVKGEVMASHNSEITVEGSVENPSSFEGLEEVDGDIRYADPTVTSVYRSSVTVNGDVTGGTVTAQHNSDLSIDGDVTSDNFGVYVTNHSSATITGSVSAEYAAVRIKNDATVFVDGDVVSKDEGIAIYIDSAPYDPYGPDDINADPNSEITILGTVQSASESVLISISPEYTPDAENDWNWPSVEEVIDALPTIIVQTLKPEGDYVLVNASPILYSVGGELVTAEPSYSDTDKNAISEALLSNINYIVNKENVDEATIAVYGTSVENGYIVAKETQKITLKSTDSGYILANVSAGDYADIQQNDDGSYSILVNRGGDLRLNATVVVRPAPSQPSSDNSGSTTSDDSDYTSVLLNYVPSADPVTADYTKGLLIVDLTWSDYTAILRSTLQEFQDNGIQTAVIRSRAGSYTIAISDLLSLTEGRISITFYEHNGILNLYLDSALITTFSMVGSV